MLGPGLGGGGGWPMQHALGSRTGPRKQPPHQVEVEAAEQNVSRICHKVYLPNDTSEVSLPAPPPTPPGAHSQSKAPPHWGHSRRAGRRLQTQLCEFEWTVSPCALLAPLL